MPLILQQSSPYRDQQAYSPQPSPTSPSQPSPNSPPQLIHSYDSNNSSDYNSSSHNSNDDKSQIKILINERDSIEQNQALGGRRLCPLDSKVFAEHFSLDDLSASFRSLYKSVFTQSISGGVPIANIETRSRNGMLIFSYFVSTFSVCVS